MVPRKKFNTVTRMLQVLRRIKTAAVVPIIKNGA
jgi:hypothetical protein